MGELYTVSMPTDTTTDRNEHETRPYWECSCPSCTERAAADEEQYETEYQGCECEIDWNCGCGRYGGATWLEVRYEGRDD